MKFLLIAFKSLKRKRIRSGLTIGGVAIAVMVLISLIGFDAGYQAALSDDIDRMGFQLLVTAKGCPYEAATLMLKGGGGIRYMDQDVYEKIIADERIDKITPQLVTTVFDRGLDDGQGGITLYVGITESFLELKPWVAFHDGGWFSGGDADEVIMGYEAAEMEQRKIGDQVFVSGVDKVLDVVGIFERTGTQDDGMVFMPMKSVQRVFDLEGKISGIGIKLKSLTDIAQFEEDLYHVPSIQVVSMAQVRGTILNLVSSAKVLANSIAAIAVIIAIIGVMNTILMSVFERTRQIGVMKALGASRLDVFRIVWMETALVCLIGGVIGVVLALMGGQLVEQLIRSMLPYAPSGPLVIITLDMVMKAVIGAVIVGLVAGVYPSLRAAAMRPVEAIRNAE